MGFRTLTLITLGVVLLSYNIVRMRRDVGILGLLAPSTIFIGGAVARFGLGSFIVYMTPEENVLRGEYDQYLVTWQYIEKTSGLWVAYIVASGLAYCAIYKVLFQKYEDRWKDRLMSLFRVYSEKPIDIMVNGLTTLTVALLAVFALEAIVGMISGSTDRGTSYSYWVSQAFKPVSSFVALSRIRQLAFLLMPLALRKTNSVAIRIALVGLALCILWLGFISGGRGSVLYPIVMIWLGWILSGAKRKDIIIWTLSLGIGIGALVPIIAAYRDSPTIRSTSSSDIIGRTIGFSRGIGFERIRYRVDSIGRELYACSDAFLFLERNKRMLNFGYTDINPSLIKDILVPRLVSSDKSFQKNDGSSIAKESMNVEVKGWFPCISTPGDLWRRGGYGSVVFGGVTMGLLICMLDVGWLWVGSHRVGLITVLMTLFPATYIHFGLYGTLREMIWQIGWELPKYLVVILILSFTGLMLSKLNAREH